MSYKAPYSPHDVHLSAYVPTLMEFPIVLAKFVRKFTTLEAMASTSSVATFVYHGPNLGDMSPKYPLPIT